MPGLAWLRHLAWSTVTNDAQVPPGTPVAPGFFAVFAPSPTGGYGVAVGIVFAVGVRGPYRKVGADLIGLGVGVLGAAASSSPRRAVVVRLRGRRSWSRR